MAKIFAILCCLLLCSATIDCYENSSISDNATSTKTSISKKTIRAPPPAQLNYSMDLEELVDLWNPMLLIPFWMNRGFEDVKISTKCDEDITRFLNELASGTSWALKMLDANGRHTGGLLSGSRYWMGASDQCREMDYDFGDAMRHNRSDVPPFRICVNAVRLELDIFKPEINGSYDITVSVCMPASCRIDDVAELMRYSTNGLHPNLPREVTINRVRNLSEGYNLWDDKIFYIILITVVLVMLLVILGTSYDIALRYQVANRDETMRNNRTVGGAGVGGILAPSKIMKTEDDFNENITISKLWSINQHNGSLDVLNDKAVPRPMSEALLSFSLLLNISKLGSHDVGNDTLAPIHGLRFISMLWIILVHTCLLTNEVSDNKMFRSKAEEDFLYQTISNGTYAVDTFFFISGCLVSFLYFRTISKQRMKEKKITQGFFGKIMQFIGMMAYRYCRLTPPYLLVIGFIQVSMKWYHDHSIIEFTSVDHLTCEKFWWRNALYINTYFDMNDRCMTWSWYLANDTQFYTIGIIILIVAASYTSAGAVLGVVFLITSWITTSIITLNTKHIPTIKEPFAHYESLYDKPWTRIGPYLIGMALGWYLCRVECKLKLTKTIVALGWSVSIVTLLSIVYGLYGNNLDPISSALYTALSHSGWAVSVGFILMACVTGNGGLANKILSWKYLYPLSRLTYCAYLVHPALTRAMILRGESTFHLTQGFVAILFFGITVATFAVSLWLSLLFEAPMVSLLRIVHPLRQWKKE